MIHAFYADLLDELAQYLEHMPVPFVLMISVIDETTKAAATALCTKIPRIGALHIRVVPNRGRDIAPFLLTFRKEILALDLVCHLHTKKSLHAGSEQDQWRHYLFDSLVGSTSRISWILGMFQAMPQLGMIYPESFVSLAWWAHTWLSNVDVARELGARLGMEVDTEAYLDYPAGSMFWARTSALRPLFDLELPLQAFPAEQGQTDGTTQHVIERMLGLIVPHQGMVLGILPADGSMVLRSQGERNWHAYFSAPLEYKIGMAAIDAHIVSFDLFDTLAWRPFLHPAGARSYLAYLVEKNFGLRNFALLRRRAEDIARAHQNSDVDCAAIYTALARLPELTGIAVDAIRELELVTEERVLQPRPAVVEAAHTLQRSGMRVIAVSDMYLGAEALQRVLPPSVTRVMQKIRVSCETGWRKDSGAAWRELPLMEGVRPDRWLHVGDNEHSDMQLPQALGFIPPVHTLRSSALLELVPALRDLRPNSAQRERWQDQLWLGLVANHFNDLADRDPGAFGEQLTIEAPETLGYAVLGPLVLDYIAWLARLALEHGAGSILFLSREGHLLLRAFQHLQQTGPHLDAIHARYLLVSRRAVNTPAIHRIEDLTGVFAAPYSGSLNTLLRARLGARVAGAVAAKLGVVTSASDVFLPEMSARLIDLLRPAATTVLDIAREERETYLEYWANQAGDGTVIVADIGYAGTIQNQLTKLTSRALGGAYFAASQAMDRVSLNQSWARARFHDARNDDEVVRPVMKYHLLLEAMLAAPDGQFSHFERRHGNLVPVYSPDAMSKERWAVVERIHAGCLRFINDVCSVTGSDTSALAFDRDHVQVPLECFGSAQWKPAGWADALSVEDSYTGRGDVQPLAG